MAKKIENEQVVNRFLLSTVYALVAALALYFLNKLATETLNPGLALSVMEIMLWGGLICLVISIAVCVFVKKKFTLYYPVVFLVIAAAGAFMRYGNLMPSVSFLPGFNDMTRRILMVGVGIAVLYIYELFVYFLRVNKVDDHKNQKKAK